MSILFVAGAGTDIGKTYMTTAIVRRLRDRGFDAQALKPVVSGFDPGSLETSDPGLLLTAMGREINTEGIDSISPFRFAAALSPERAARAEGKRLIFSDVLEFCRRKMVVAPGWFLIEGVGGLMSPVAEDATGLDLARALGAPVLLVVGTYLGAISHALTAATALAHSRLKLAAIVVNESATGSVGLNETVEAISRFLPNGRFIGLERWAESRAIDEIIAAVLEP